MDAEDILQEAFLRWLNRKPSEAITSPKAYLSTIVTRLALDQLRSARAQREVYVGEWLPEPLLTGQSSDYFEQVEKSDSLSTAFLVVLENLSPEERAAFILREVFDYEYAEIAEIINKNEANCRQLVRRAKQHLSERRPRYNPTRQQQEQMLNRFLQACAGGDMNGLLNLLTQDVVTKSDGGGKVTAARNPIYGPEKVARLILGILQKAPADFSAQISEINGTPGLLTFSGGQIHNILTLDIDPESEKIRAIYLVLNPDKLQHIRL